MLKIKIIFIFFVLGCAAIFLHKYFSPYLENYSNLQQVRFTDISGWNENNSPSITDSNNNHTNSNFIRAEMAFEKTCSIATDDKATNPEKYNQFLFAGKKVQIKKLCEKFLAARALNGCCFDFKNFLEQNTTPYRVRTFTKSTGLYTGYYIPELEASLTKTERFKYPVYALPVDETLRTKTNAEISSGALENKNLEILYVADDVDLFFAQIQGSFIAKLQNGRQLTVGYAGKNSKNYYAIGKYFIENKIFTREEISAEKIIDWLKNKPEKKQEILNLNPSYVYFKILETLPQTSSGATVTTKATLAVDKKFIPTGALLFLQTELPNTELASNKLNSSEKLNKKLNQKFNQLMVAQDTGGAIKNTMRGDVFFGYGTEAFAYASHMNAEGKIYILIPKL